MGLVLIVIDGRGRGWGLGWSPYILVPCLAGDRDCGATDSQGWRPLGNIKGSPIQAMRTLLNSSQCHAKGLLFLCSSEKNCCSSSSVLFLAKPGPQSLFAPLFSQFVAMSSFA